MFGLPNLMSKNGQFAFLIVAVIVAIVVWYFAFGGKEKCEKKKTKSKGENKANPQENQENQDEQEIQDLADEINSD